MGRKLIASNKKAKHDYFIENTYEAGLVLTGTEIKSVRQGKVNLKESYARVERGEVFVYSMNISPYDQGNIYNVDPMRPRKLLLNRAEIRKIDGILQHLRSQRGRPLSRRTGSGHFFRCRLLRSLPVSCTLPHPVADIQSRSLVPPSMRCVEGKLRFPLATRAGKPLRMSRESLHLCYRTRR